MGYRHINARADTVATKPSFRSAFKRRPCLIPADGFYEWRKLDKGKRPYFIHIKDEEPFAFTGLWENWHKSVSSRNAAAASTVLLSEHRGGPASSEERRRRAGGPGS